MASALAHATTALDVAGIPNARQEALRLWASVARSTPGNAWLEREAPIAVEKKSQFFEVVGRRANGWPFAYAAGWASFRHLDLEVDHRVLIPRPETEGLVEHVLGWCRQRSHWGVAVDVGTGSGCIALSLATEGQFAHVVGVDVSREALHVAEANRSRFAVRMVHLLASSLMTSLPGTAVDVMVSNPPYITPDEYETLDGSVRHYEPTLALVSPDGGMGHITSLCSEAMRCLRPGGLLALEIDAQRGRQSVACAHAVGLCDARVLQDLFGRDRFLLAERPLVIGQGV